MNWARYLALLQLWATYPSSQVAFLYANSISFIINFPVGSQIFNGMYTPLYNLTELPGMAFFIGAAMLLLPLLLTISVLVLKKYVVNTTSKETTQYDNEAFQK